MSKTLRNILSFRVDGRILGIGAAFLVFVSGNSLSSATLTYFLAGTAKALSQKDSSRLISVTINDMGTIYEELTLPVPVGALLYAKSLELGPADLITISPEVRLSDNDYVLILRPTRILLKDGGGEQELFTFAKTVEGVLREKAIPLDEFDILEPARDTRASTDMEIRITRITKKEITRTIEVPFKTVKRENPDLTFGITRTLNGGTHGHMQERVLVTQKNGKTVNEEVLATKIIDTPVTEILEVGTKIEIGRIQEGGASWYRFRGGMFAASTTFLKGTYVRVTSLATGKTIIVQINDWGPDPAVHPDRVIDLDAVAFQKLASLSKGLIAVRVEEIL